MANFSTDGSTCIERSLPVTLSTQSRLPTLDDINTNFEVAKICQWIIKNGYSKVCLQFPDTFLEYSGKIYDIIKGQVEADIYILGDTTYSSCCVDEVAAMHVQADAVVHYGHSCFSTSSIPVFTVLPKYYINLNVAMTALKSFGDRDCEKLCLFYDAAYHHMKDQISAIWFEYYPNSFIAHVNIKHPKDCIIGRHVNNKNGKVLYSNEMEDFRCIYFGSRSQTLFNCVVSIKAQDWYCLEPEVGEINRLDEAPWFKRRRYLIEKCKDAKNIGILVCKLSGQATKEIIMRMKELCKISNKKSYIVSVGKPNVAKLANFPEIDIYVMIACPENDLYNRRDFYKPLVYPYELEVAVNTNRPVLLDTHVPDFEDLLQNKRAYCDIGNVDPNTDMSLITGQMRSTELTDLDNNVTDIEKTNWAVDNIGNSLSQRTWTGLQQNLGDTEVKIVEAGRSGLPISYENEPKPN